MNSGWANFGARPKPPCNGSAISAKRRHASSMADRTAAASSSSPVAAGGAPAPGVVLSPEPACGEPARGGGARRRATASDSDSAWPTTAPRW